MRDHRTRVKWVFRPGYTAEQYDAVRAVCVDGHGLPETFAQWVEYSHASDHRMNKLGRNVVRINLELEPFRVWCAERGLELNGKARQAYAEAIGEQRLRGKIS